MNELSHTAIEAELAAYATGGLDAPAHARVAQHLEACVSCRQTVREYEAVLRLVPLSLPVAAPPPGAQLRLLARARSGSGAPLRSTRGPWWAVLAQAPRLLGAGLVLALALVVGLALQRPLAPQVIAMAGSPAAPNATGVLALSDGERAELTVAGLPPLPPDRSYQLWFVQPDSTRQSGGVFTVNADGRATLTLRMPGPRGQFVRVGVTEEPRAGSPAPTGPNLLGGEL